MLDSVHLEAAGVPTVTFVTEPFADAARTLARIHGMPDVPLIVIAADYLENSEAVIRERSIAVLDEILGALTAAPPWEVEAPR